MELRKQSLSKEENYLTLLLLFF